MAYSVYDRVKNDKINHQLRLEVSEVHEEIKRGGRASERDVAKDIYRCNRFIDWHSYFMSFYECEPRMCFMENSSKNHFTSHSICNNTRYTHTVYCIRMHTYHNVQLSGYHNIVSLTCQWSCYERKQWTIVSFYKQMGNDSHVLIPNRAAKTIELNNSHRKNDFAISWSRIIIVITSNWCFIIWIGFYVSVSFVRSLFFCHYVIITIEFWPRSDDPATICNTLIALFPCCTIYAVIKLFF